MAVNGNIPAIQLINSNGAPIVGAVLKVYDAGTTNYKSIYSDDGLAVALSNPLTGANASNASGFFPVFYMASGTYKLRAETSGGTLIWEYDDLDTGLSAGAGALPIASGGTGATTAAAARAALDVPSNSELAALSAQISDFTSSLTNTIGFPQGRLTPTSNTPIITTGVAAGTAVYYTPYVGNTVPIYDGTQFNPATFAELTLTLASQHTGNALFDVFAINDSGTIRLVTGPAWTTATAGSGARGSGAGTTELTRVNGLLVNANAMATARNGSSTYSVAQYRGTYLGSLFIDATDGQISCLTAFGQSRKWSIWNYYNRVPIVLQAGDATSSWTYGTATIRAANGSSNNVATAFCGVAEEFIKIELTQRAAFAMNTTFGSTGIGVNSTTAYSGKNSSIGGDNAGGTQEVPEFNTIAKHLIAPGIGINNLYALEKGTGTGNVTFYGGNDDMLLTVEWRG